MASTTLWDATSPIRMRLDAHDEDPAPQDPPVDDPATDPEPEPPADPPKAKEPAKPADPKLDSDPKLDKEHSETSRREIAAREKAKAAEAEARRLRAELEAATKKVAEFEDGQKSELDKALAAAERAQARERAANLRSVTTELRAAAIEADAADAGIVVDLLNRDPDKYLTDTGIDVDAIEAAVAGLLESKPLLKRQAPAPSDPAPEPVKRERPAPKPDPAQGGRGGGPEKDYRTAPREDVDAALAEMGFRSRR